MIHLLDASIEQHLRAKVPLPSTIDVSFATPDKRWGAARTKPTVNLFLWDIRKDLRSAQSGYTEERTVEGSIQRIKPDPEVAFRYLVTTWAGEPRDEHQLLGAVLRAALASSTVDEAALAPGLPAVGAVHVSVGSSDGRPNDFWNSLDGQLKPNLELTVRMFVDLDQVEDAGPLVGELAVGLERGAAVVPPPPPSSPFDAPADRVPRRRRGTAVVSGPGRPVDPAEQPEG